jgi:hypothetical protein
VNAHVQQVAQEKPIFLHQPTRPPKDTLTLLINSLLVMCDNTRPGQPRLLHQRSTHRT